MKRFTLTMIFTLGLSACTSTGFYHDPEEVKKLPDSYFKERLTYLTNAEYNEYMRRKREKSAESRREGACIFGSRPAIDRSKLNCENVKGSPEYKAKHGN